MVSGDAPRLTASRWLECGPASTTVTLLHYLGWGTMRLSQLFEFLVTTTGRVVRVRMPAECDETAMRAASRVTDEIPRIFREVRASEARTDYLTGPLPVVESPTIPIRNAWFDGGSSNDGDGKPLSRE